MVTLQDIDNALDRAQILASVDISPDEQQEILTCLHNARQMLIELGHEASTSLARMTDTLDRLGDIAESF
jgi:hypothetical protein